MVVFWLKFQWNLFVRIQLRIRHNFQGFPKVSQGQWGNYQGLVVGSTVISNITVKWTKQYDNRFGLHQLTHCSWGDFNEILIGNFEADFSDWLLRYLLFPQMKDTTLLLINHPNSKVHGAKMGPPGSCQPQTGPMLAPWNLLSGIGSGNDLVSSGNKPLLEPVSYLQHVYWFLHLVHLSRAVGWYVDEHLITLQEFPFPISLMTDIIHMVYNMIATLVARFMEPTWGPSGVDRTQVGPMLAPWNLLYGL